MAGQTVKQGKRTQLAIGFEKIQAGLRAAAFWFVHVKSLTFLPARPIERSPNNNPSGQRRKGRNLVVSLPFRFSTAPVLDEIVRIQAHLRGFWAITNPAATVYQWVLRTKLLGDTPPATVDTLSTEGDVDGFCQLGQNVVLSGMELKWEAGKFAELSYEGMASNYTRLADPVEDVGNAGTYTGNGGVPAVRGYRNPADDLTDPIVIEVTTGGALGVAKVKLYKESELVGPGVERIITGGWQNAYDSADDHLATFSGNPDEPLQFMFPTGGTFTLGDKWTIESPRVRMVATYPAKNELTAVAVTTEIDGVEYVIDSGSLKVNKPLVPWSGGGSKLPYGWLENGEEAWTITLKRKNTDDVVFEAYEAEKVLPIKVTMLGDIVGAGLYREQWELNFAATQIASAGSNQTSQGALDEDITAEAFDNGVDPVCEETIICGIAAA